MHNNFAVTRTFVVVPNANLPFSSGLIELVSTTVSQSQSTTKTIFNNVGGMGYTVQDIETAVTELLSSSPAILADEAALIKVVAAKQHGPLTPSL